VAKGSQGSSRAQSDERIGVSPDAKDRRRTWALAPSDFAFLWDECRRCFYRKIVLKQPRSRTSFPKVFNRIDKAMKEAFVGRRSEALVSRAPRGTFGYPDLWVKSSPLILPESDTRCVIRGRLDSLISCDDATKAVVEFKTVEPNEDHLATYGRQLHAYGFALGHPVGKPPQAVSALGIVCFTPQRFVAEATKANLHGDLEWIEVPRDDAAFFEFLEEVVAVLDQPEPPSPSPTCPWCQASIGVQSAA